MQLLRCSLKAQMTRGSFKGACRQKGRQFAGHSDEPSSWADEEVSLVSSPAATLASPRVLAKDGDNECMGRLVLLVLLHSSAEPWFILPKLRSSQSSAPSS